MKRLLVLTVLAFSLPSSGSAQAPGIDAVSRVIDSAIQSRGFAGAVVGIATNGRVAFIKGYGLADLEQRTPMTEKTVLRIGSVTKQFTAALVLKLADQGKLSLDDTLSRYVPEFPRGGEVTIRQLLSHTSGIMSYTNPKVMSQLKDAGRREWTIKDLVTRIQTLTPLYEFEPGTGWSYSNSGYMLLGAVIEKVTGKSYADALKGELLDPLAMHDTQVDNLAEVVPDRARGYETSKTASSGFRNAEFISMGAAGPAGAMRSTAADLLKWHAALFGGQVLKPETLAQMQAPGRLKDGRPSSKGRVPPAWVPETTEYGLGLFLGKLDGHTTVGHGGAIFGFNTWMETLPDDKVTIVIMANTGYPAAEQIAPKVVQAWLRSRQIP